MRYLVDTHVLLWQAVDSPRMSADLRARLIDQANDLAFSVVSLWELVIKSGMGRPDFSADAAALRAGLLEFGYREIDVTAEHVLEVSRLPSLHRDPFDRLLLAQARADQLTLLSADAALTAYGFPVEPV